MNIWYEEVKEWLYQEKSYLKDTDEWIYDKRDQEGTWWDKKIFKNEQWQLCEWWLDHQGTTNYHADRFSMTWGLNKDDLGYVSHLDKKTMYSVHGILT